MISVIFKKQNKELTSEDLQFLADAPLSVTKDFFESRDIANKVRKLRLRLPKIVTKKVQERYLAKIDTCEAELNRIIEKAQGKL